jgi:hypothetical protein
MHICFLSKYKTGLRQSKLAYTELKDGSQSKGMAIGTFHFLHFQITQLKCHV